MNALISFSIVIEMYISIARTLREHIKYITIRWGHFIYTIFNNYLDQEIMYKGIMFNEQNNHYFEWQSLFLQSIRSLFRSFSS